MGTENEPSERLEGTDGSQRGGLVIKKKPKKSGDDSGDSGFKKPSIYGLEKRAKEKREEQRRESEREKIISSRDKKYRERRVETPSNTGGVSDKYRERRREREDYERSKRNYVSSRDRDRRDRDDDRERGSRDNWEDDDDDRRSRRGSHRSWETPTPGRTPRESPSPYVGSRSERSDSRRKETPLATPSYKYNDWGSKKIDYKGKDDGSESTRMSWNEAELKEYEADQKQADRDWYTMDEGNDPNRLDPDQDYVAKKEEQMKKKRDNMKLSARHQQYNVDNEKWEAELLLRSGVVQQTNFEEDFDESTGSKIHILVHNIVPPFLDGRTIFTKQPEPVVPVKGTFFFWKSSQFLMEIMIFVVLFTE